MNLRLHRHMLRSKSARSKFAFVVPVAALFAMLSVSVASRAHAQDFPVRPITMVVPFPAGGNVDNNVRFLSRVLSEKLKQPVIIENKSGAGGVVGAEHLIRSKPDGYTIMATSAGVLATYQYVMKLSFDPQTAFVPIHGLTVSYAMLVVRQDAAYQNVKDFIDFAKKNPEKLNYFSLGTGSGQHVAAELLQNEAGIKLMQVPYKGAAPALTDLLSGVIDVAFDFYSIMKPHIESGKLKVLAVESPERLKALPDVPTFAELGYPNAIYPAYSAFLAPAGTPDNVVKTLAQALDETLRDERVVKYFDELSVEPLQGYSGEKLRQYIDTQRARVKKTIEAAGIKPE